MTCCGTTTGETVYNDPVRHDFKIVGDHREVVIVADAVVTAAELVVAGYAGSITGAVTPDSPVAGKSSVVITLPDPLVASMVDGPARDYVLKLLLDFDFVARNILSGKLQCYSLRSW